MAKIAAHLTTTGSLQGVNGFFTANPGETPVCKIFPNMGRPKADILQVVRGYADWEGDRFFLVNVEAKDDDIFALVWIAHWQDTGNEAGQAI